MTSVKYSKLFVYSVYIIFLSFVLYAVFQGRDDAPSIYASLWTLPAGHLLINLVLLFPLLKGDVFEDLPVLIVGSTFTLRNAVTPLCMVLTSDYSSKLGYPASMDYVDSSIFVFLYETLAVYLLMFYCTHRRNHPRREKLGRVILTKNQTIFNSLLLFGVALSVGLFFIIPELKTHYYTIFTNDITHVFHEELYYSTGIKRALATSNKMLVAGVRLALSTFLIVKLRMWSGTLKSYLLCNLVVLSQLLLMNDSNAYVIMLMFALFILVFRLFPAYRKLTLKLLGSGIALFFVMMNINRFSQNSYRGFSSVFLQAYFPGISNFAGVFSIPDYSLSATVRQFFFDLYGAIPFKTTLFGYKEGDRLVLPLVWSLWNHAPGQIMPNAAMSYFYFGSYFSPLLSILIVKLGFDIFEKAKAETSPYMYTFLMYLTLYLSAAPIVYNFYIVCGMFCKRALFMLLFSFWSPLTFSQIDPIFANSQGGHKGSMGLPPPPDSFRTQFRRRQKGAQQMQKGFESEM